MSTTYLLRGVNDEADTCSACGRSGLKRVAWLAALDADGNAEEAAPYGTDCAGMLLRGTKSRKNTDLVTGRGQAMEAARRWMAAGHTPTEAAKGVWNRFGYGCEPRGEGVGFYFDGAWTIITAEAA